MAVCVRADGLNMHNVSYEFGRELQTKSSQDRRSAGTGHGTVALLQLRPCLPQGAAARLNVDHGQRLQRQWRRCARSVLGSWVKPCRNNKRWERRRTPTQDPSTDLQLLLHCQRRSIAGGRALQLRRRGLPLPPSCLLALAPALLRLVARSAARVPAA